MRDVGLGVVVVESTWKANCRWRDASHRPGAVRSDSVSDCYRAADGRGMAKSRARL